MHNATGGVCLLPELLPAGSGSFVVPPELAGTSAALLARGCGPSSRNGSGVTLVPGPYGVDSLHEI